MVEQISESESQFLDFDYFLLQHNHRGPLLCSTLPIITRLEILSSKLELFGCFDAMVHGGGCCDAMVHVHGGAGKRPLRQVGVR